MTEADRTQTSRLPKFSLSNTISLNSEINFALNSDTRMNTKFENIVTKYTVDI